MYIRIKKRCGSAENKKNYFPLTHSVSFFFYIVLVSVPTLWIQGNCLGWGPSDRTGLAGTEYHQTLNRVVSTTRL